MIKNIALILIFLIVGFSLNTQGKRVYGGTLSYILYSVEKGETIYSLTSTYSVLHGKLLTDKVVGMPNKGNAKSSKLQIKSQPAKYNTISHQVARKETLYSIAKKYDCSVSDILKLNPQVKDSRRLRKKTILKIPISVISENKQKDKKVVLPEIRKTDVGNMFEVDNSNYGKYLVKKGETFYSISKKFFVTVDGLKNANPGIKINDLIPEEKIIIPKNNLNKNMFGQVHENSQLSFNNNRMRVSGYNPDAAFKIYRVCLMVPLFLSENKKLNSEVKVDSITEKILVPDDSMVLVTPFDSVAIDNEFKFYSGSKSFLNFYEGVLLAVDSLKNAGMKIELYTFDTEQKKGVVDSLLNMDIFRSFDLIIGPVFPDLQRDVATFAQENHIAFISPLSSAGNLEASNPYYFKVNPQNDYFIQQTADYMTREYSGKNIIVLKMGEYKYLQEAALIDKLRKKYRDPLYAGKEKPDYHEYLYSSGGLNSLREIMKSDKENVVFIPSRTEGQLSVAITNLNTLTKEEFPVTLIGLPAYQRYKSIQTEYFYHTNLNYLSSYFIDYKSSAVNNFIHKFRNNFFAEPDNFSFQGYDVAFYFMNALKSYGHNFISELPFLKVDLLQDNFIFKKQSESGGYINEGLFVVKYSPDYMECGVPYVEN